MLINQSTSWKKLFSHFNSELKHHTIAELNRQDHRFEQMAYSTEGMTLDFSKQKVTTETFELLADLADTAKLSQAIAELSSGLPVNTTENRAALHSACRLNPNDSLIVDSVDVNQQVQLQLSKMQHMIQRLTQGQWRGFSGKAITDVVNLGVGGSDLGPLLVCHALDEFKLSKSAENCPNPINVHFASTMDGSQVSDLFKTLNPETTLFIIVSKSFGTIDTLSNAASAQAWLSSHCDSLAIVKKQHFIGVSVSESKMDEWGIDTEHQLKLWDWVGGRFSLWSTVGLSIGLKLGMDNFRLLLKGANALDQHFFKTELNSNLPVLLGLIGIWNTNFLDINAHAILPYDARLKYLPNYLMQLEMESNGKSVTHSGEKVDYNTCPVLWGEVGPNAQHAFYQLMHQGTRKVSSDFIAPIHRFNDDNTKQGLALQGQHQLTLANCLAQSSALMSGGSTSIENTGEGILALHKLYPGDQPSTTILFDQLTPYSLGQLIALYEHKVFVMATIWGINPFDQWGVELGKIMAGETLLALTSESVKGSVNSSFDASTSGLMQLIKGQNGRKGQKS
jgi:glucose-6-phosphate isomerase